MYGMTVPHRSSQPPLPQLNLYCTFVDPPGRGRVACPRSNQALNPHASPLSRTARHPPTYKYTSMHASQPTHPLTHPPSTDLPIQLFKQCTVATVAHLLPLGFTIRRGVPFSTFLPGLLRAVEGSQERHGVSASLIMCFLRNLGPQAAAQTLEQVRGLLGLGHGWAGCLRF